MKDGGKVSGKGTGNPGRSGKQSRLKEIVNDDKVSTALRGEKKRDINEIKLGKRKNIRVLQGYNLAHRRGYEARKGYGYEYCYHEIDIYINKKSGEVERVSAFDIAYTLSYLGTSFIIGLLAGLVPFFTARKKGLIALGIFALISCGLSYLIGGILLLVPVWLFFLIVISQKKAEKGSVAG